MTLAYRATGTFTDANFGNASFAFPAGMADGDVLLLPVQARGVGSSVTIDEDWLEATGSPVIRSASFRTHLFYKYVPTAAGETQPTVTQTVSGALRGRITAFSGGSSTTQFDTAGIGVDGPAVTVVEAPSITPVSAAAMVGWIFSTNDDCTLNAETQGTLAYSSNGTQGADGSLALVYELQGAPAASGTCSMTCSTNAPASTNVITFALRPAPVAATSPATALFDDILFDVDIAFGAGPFTPSPTWTRVTEYVNGDVPISILVGRESQDGTANAGSCTLALNNSITAAAGRRFDPDYAAGPYYGQLNLRTPIRVWARRDGTDRPLFTGLINSWRQMYVGGSRDGYTQVSAADITSVLQNTPMPGTSLGLRYLLDGPEVYMPMGEDEIGSITDLSGNGWTGRYTSRVEVPDSILQGQPGSKSKSLSLVGVTGDGTVAGMSGNTSPENILSLEAWVRVTAFDTAGVAVTGSAVAVSIIATGVSNGLRITAYQSVDGTFWLGYVTDVNDLIGLVQLGDCTLHRTDHICVVPEDTLAVARLYVNGQEQLPFLDTTPLTLEGGAAEPGLAVYVSPASAAAFGHIAMYPVALTAAEVREHYEAGLLGGRLETAAERLDLLAEYAGLTDAGLWDSSAMGTHTFLSEGVFGGSVLDEMRKIIEADQGRLYVNGLGVLTAQSRIYDVQPSATAHIFSQGSYGDSAPAEIRYEDFNREPASEELLKNIVVVNGTETRDAGSVSLYGPAEETWDVPISAPTAARAFAQSRLSKYATPQPRIDRLTVNLRGHLEAELNTAQNTTLGLDLGHRITATVRPASGLGDDLVETVRVEGRRDTITPHTWLRDLYCVPAGDAYYEGPFYTIGDSTYGRIGTPAGNMIPG